MTYSVDTAWVNMYTDNVTLLSQQMNSVLGNTGVKGDAKGEYKFFERIDSVSMTEKTSSNLATSFTDVTHEKRAVAFQDYVINFYSDIRDAKRMLINPDSVYVKDAVAAWNRQIDSTIATALLAAATTGKGVGEAFGSTTFPTTTQTVDVNFLAGDPIGAGNGTGTWTTRSESGFTLAKILKARAVLLGNHAVVPGDRIWCAIGPDEEIDLFGIAEFKSADYNKDLPYMLGVDPQGYIANWLGIDFIRYTGLATTDPASASNHYRRCLMYTSSGLGIVKGDAPTVMIAPNPERNMALTIHVEGSVGAVRVEEKKVVEIRTSSGIADAS